MTHRGQTPLSSHSKRALGTFQNLKITLNCSCLTMRAKTSQNQARYYLKRMPWGVTPVSSAGRKRRSVLLSHSILRLYNVDYHDPQMSICGTASLRISAWFQLLEVSRKPCNSFLMSSLPISYGMTHLCTQFLGLLLNAEYI
jgi:hypothetical protein